MKTERRTLRGPDYRRANGVLNVVGTASMTYPIPEGGSLKVHDSPLYVFEPEDILEGLHQEGGDATP